MGFFDFLKPNKNTSISKSYGNIPPPETKKEADNLNKSFRRNDIARWSSDDSVLGFEIKRSNNCNADCDLCKAGKGKYPKDFDWDGWHEGCKCYLVPILINNAQFDKLQLMTLKGKDTKKYSSSLSIKKIPSGLLSYCSKNKIDLDENQPMWFLRNKKYFEVFQK